MKNQCKINLARTAGFCFGVKRALRIAHELAAGGAVIHMIGDLVHNEQVIIRLEKAGIKKISRLGNGRNKTLLIRAHGAGNSLLSSARKRGYAIADATCPMVRAIHGIVRTMSRKGRRIIVLGDRRHDEVQGIVGQTRKPTIVIDRLDNIPWNRIAKIKKAAIVVQSTQNIDHILPVVAALRKTIPDVQFFNTICRPTRMKQAEMKSMPLANDVMIVIGSRSSANTRRLFEISRSLNPRTHWIESDAEIKQGWFQEASRIGITAGASTPRATTRSVIERIKKMTEARHRTSAKCGLSLRKRKTPKASINRATPQK